VEELLKLTVEERILIYGLQPEEGSYELLSSFRLLEKHLRFSEEETRKYDIRNVSEPTPAIGTQPRMMVAFNKEVAEGYTKDIKIPARVSSYMSEKLSKMDEENKLLPQYVGLYERIYLGKKVDDGNVDTDKQSSSDNGK
jgi:hypothetical protein